MTRTTFQPRIEPLEDRTLMSTCHVTRLGDVGAGMGFRGDLRYCINKVNAELGPDGIDFRVTGTINLTAALPHLSSDIDIQGPGSSLLTVRRDSGGNYRIFTVPNSASVEMSGLTMSNGLVSSTTDVMEGGGISNTGTLVIRDSLITGNTASSLDDFARGGGIHNLGSLTLVNAAVAGNRANAGFEAQGGGIYNGGDLLISDSDISRNRATGEFTYGGAIYNLGSVSVSNSTIADNSSEDQFDGSGGGIHIQAGSVSIYSSTIAYNRAEGLFGLGGGISNRGMLTVLNSTIASNSGVRGAGIFNRGPLTVISHSTISLNFDPHASGGGGGMESTGPDDLLFMRNTIIAGNENHDFAGYLASSNYNLFGDSEYGFGHGSSDLLNVDPLLGPLADNGGPTLTMALLPGSPAIDAGDNADAPEFDQRGPGFPRIVNGTIDIGAFEVQTSGALNTPTSFAVLLTADLDTDDTEKGTKS